MSHPESSRGAGLGRPEATTGNTSHSCERGECNRSHSLERNLHCRGHSSHPGHWMYFSKKVQSSERIICLTGPILGRLNSRVGLGVGQEGGPPAEAFPPGLPAVHWCLRTGAQREWRTHPCFKDQSSLDRSQSLYSQREANAGPSTLFLA